ncbi:MAG TPA: tetratricopeptide repeat protein, partial [Ignavibacteriaceae bacterium]|nr:tetratricopeptide repeat protein [Ignavibacteriaceae bacterium]
MNIRNVICFIFFSLSLFAPDLAAQPLPHTQDLKTEALSHMKNGRYGEAINLLNNYISARPQQAEGYNLRGIAYEHRGQYEQAVYDFRSARKLEPQNSDINDNLSRVTEAWYKLIYNDIEGYKREIAIDPAKADNYLQIGMSYKNLGEWVEAELWYDKYLSMAQASPDEIIRYTEILAKNNHIAKGEPILKKYTGAHPDDQRLWSRYGYFLLWLGKTGSAINAFEKALQLKPFFKEAMDGLARAKGNGYIYTFNDTASYKYYKYGIKSGGYAIDNYFRRLKRFPGDNETRIKLIT